MQTLEQKLATLEQCGIRLSEPFTVNDLLQSTRRHRYDKSEYDTLLVEMGMEPDEEPYQKRSANVWYFDTEAIEDHGDYIRIAERMVELTQGSLSLQDIKDYVDIENDEAWLTFTFKGKPMKLDFHVQDDWIDTSIFRKFTELLQESDLSKIYLYYDLGGQDCIIACVRKTEFECLQSKGINFVPL